MIPSPLDPDPRTREMTEADVLRFHYTLLSIASSPASASPTFLPPTPAPQPASSSTPTTRETKNQCPTCSVGNSAINPALLALPPQEDQRMDLGRLARAVNGSEEEEGNGKGKKRARNSDSTLLSTPHTEAGPSMKKKTISRKSTSAIPSSPHPISSTPLPAHVAGTPIPISTHLAKFRASQSHLKSNIPQYLLHPSGHIPFTPRTAAGLEMDELNTPFQPVLFGRASQQHLIGTPVAGMGGVGGMSHIGVGERMHPGWAVGTPAAAAGRKG